MQHVAQNRLRKWLEEASTVCVGAAALAAIGLKELAEAGLYRVEHLVKNQLRRWAEELSPDLAIRETGDPELRTRDLMRELLLAESATIYALAVVVAAGCVLVIAIGVMPD